MARVGNSSEPRPPHQPQMRPGAHAAPGWFELKPMRPGIERVGHVWPPAAVAPA